jgi:hypothetical protein
MGFQTRKVKKKISKHFKQNIIILDFELKLFSHYFAEFEVHRGIIDHSLVHP